MVAELPLIKLVYLFVRQTSKYIANGVKAGAKRSHVFRNYVIVPGGQLIHNLETRFKMLFMGLGFKVVEVKPLNEQMAVELGADVLGEVVIYSIAAGLLIHEFRRSAINSRLAKEREAALYERLNSLERRAEEQGLLLEQQNAKLRESQRQLLSLPSADALTNSLKSLRDRLQQIAPHEQSSAAGL